MPGQRTPWLYAKSRCTLKDFSIQPVASKTKASHVDEGRDYLRVCHVSRVLVELDNTGKAV